MRKLQMAICFLIVVSMCGSIGFFGYLISKSDIEKKEREKMKIETSGQIIDKSIYLMAVEMQRSNDIKEAQLSSSQKNSLNKIREERKEREK